MDTAFGLAIGTARVWKIDVIPTADTIASTQKTVQTAMRSVRDIVSLNHCNKSGVVTSGMPPLVSSQYRLKITYE
jgi:hypothetical protein